MCTFSVFFFFYFYFILFLFFVFVLINHSCVCCTQNTRKIYQVYIIINYNLILYIISEFTIPAAETTEPHARRRVADSYIHYSYTPSFPSPLYRNLTVRYIIRDKKTLPIQVYMQRVRNELCNNAQLSGYCIYIILFRHIYIYVLYTYTLR